jgi:hypothetical protein
MRAARVAAVMTAVTFFVTRARALGDWILAPGSPHYLCLAGVSV